MERVIVDTGFLSSVLKAGLLETTLGIIEKRRLFITEQVKSELKKCRLYADHQHKFSKGGPIITLNFKREEEIEELSNLGSGEVSCIIYCRKKGDKLLIDDREANKKAKEYGIKTLTIPDLLFLGKKKEVVEKEDMKNFIKNLKMKDNYLFPNEIKKVLLDYD